MGLAVPTQHGRSFVELEVEVTWSARPHSTNSVDQRTKHSVLGPWKRMPALAGGSMAEEHSGTRHLAVETMRMPEQMDLCFAFDAGGNSYFMSGLDCAVACPSFCVPGLRILLGHSGSSLCSAPPWRRNNEVVVNCLLVMTETGHELLRTKVISHAPKL